MLVSIDTYQVSLTGLVLVTIQLVLHFSKYIITMTT